jgi:AcrR family transcriptional regulator
MKVVRRLGAPGSPIWHSMLDAAEETLREEGYGALTSRRVAERIGVKQRLVYYYFLTMDDLIVETFRRLAKREKDRLAAALTSKTPIREIWDVCVHTTDTRLVSEFMALANRIDTLRVEVKNHIEACRKLQVAALTKAMKASDSPTDVPTVALAIFATSAALALHREAEIGVRTGHKQVAAVIGNLIESLERAGKKS